MDKNLRNKLFKKYNVLFNEDIYISCNDGWYWLLDNTLNSIYNYQKYNSEQFIKITTIKEKFGLLNIYYFGSNEIVRGMTIMATYMSSNICEFCGTTENVGKTKHWISTICENCYKNHKNLSTTEWKPNINPRLLKLEKIINTIKNEIPHTDNK